MNDNTYTLWVKGPSHRRGGYMVRIDTRDNLPVLGTLKRAHTMPLHMAKLIASNLHKRGWRAVVSTTYGARVPI